ncbi:MAG: glycosyl transferase, group 1 [Candidatus Acidoferrum typicum]|nr:glycosyl transferase, group 1 [Candidatus Acidoferrum typicum]
MRDAIVLSGWRWETCNVPERIALALAHAGSRVLYCENPVSFIRRARSVTEVVQGVFAFRPVLLSHRLNRVPAFLRTQSAALANQVLAAAATLKLKDPLVFYPHGDYCLGLCREFKKRGLPLVHICMDYELATQMEHVQQSDLTLAIPRVAFQELKVQFGEKIRTLPQLSIIRNGTANVGVRESSEFAKIPRPRLGYLGNLVGRASLPLLGELLSKHPEWNFISFGSKKWFPLPNEHVLPWRAQDELQAVLAGLDVGLMPYDCANPYNLHCVPLKLFDYFALGMPVVSTPIVAIAEYGDLVYAGETAAELAGAVTLALKEADDSPKKARRMALAREHSFENVSEILREILDEWPA